MSAVVDAFLLAALNQKADGKVFNIGGQDVISLRKLAGLLVRLYGSGEYAIKSFPADRRAIDIGDYYADFNLIRRNLGWKPSATLKTGLERTLSFFKEHIHHYV